jgi:anti-sigma factor RsiW
MARGEHWISDEDLHAYIDDMLDPTRRLAVALYLAKHPSEAARAEAFRAQKEAVRALFDHVLAQPVPPRLVRPVGRCVRRRSALAALGMTAIVLAGGYAIASQVPRLREALLAEPAVLEPHPTGTSYPEIWPIPGTSDRSLTTPI